MSKHKISNGKMQRVMDHFSLLYAAGTLAAKFEILSIDENELISCLKSLLFQWKKDIGKTLSEEDQSIEQIVSYLQTYGATRFPSFHSSKENIDASMCSGFRRTLKSGEVEWLILSEVFKKEVCRGLNIRGVSQALAKKGFLITAQKSTFTSNLRLPILGQTRVYRISGNILSELKE